MYSRLLTITPPSAYPVTLDEVKTYCVVDFDDDDTLLQSLIAMAVEHVQGILGRQLMGATYELHLSAFPAGELFLSPPPVTEVQSITYLDTDGASRTFANWQAFLSSDRPHIAPLASWPAVQTDPEAVKIRFTAGSDTVPNERARLAIMALVAHWYEHRTPTDGNAREVPHHVTRLLNGARNWSQV